MAKTSKYGSALELAIVGFIGVIIGLVVTGGLMIWLISID
jgi:hypothetical protein